MSASSHPLALTAKRGAPEPPAAVAVPMEDTVLALIDYLVQPLLPARAFPHALPSQEEQESVARQMHSVVLLYNYYHRKQFPHLVFLDFRSFCKQSTISKPSLLSFMKFMLKNVEYSLDLDKELSIMEKEIMSACNIATTVDALKNSTSMNGWPVSKVAVLLVDADLEKCYLEFGSITQGIWSLPEQRLDKPIASVIKSSSCSYPNKSSKSSLQQLAISVVQQKTGDCCSKFCVLEDHRVYSLNDEKTATMLYIMKSLDTVNGSLVGFSIKDVLSSLRGPLVKAGLTPEVTKVVENYHLLPYVDILSNLLSRAAPHSSYLNSPPRHPLDVHNLSESGRPSTMVDHGLNKSYLLPTSRDEAVEDKSAINVNTNEIGKSDVNSATISKSLNEPSFVVSDRCKIKNNSSSDQLQQSLSRKEDAGSRKSVIASPCLNKRGRDFYCSSDGGNGCTNKVDGMNIIKRQCTEEGNDGEIVGRNTSRPVQDAMDSYHLPSKQRAMPGALACFSYHQLQIATSSFSQLIGTGGFGSVYKGTLRDGTMVAVKKLDRLLHQGEREFIAEVTTIGSMHHMNLVNLCGFCSEQSHRLLVYEYMSGGSLDKWIFHSGEFRVLVWQTRFNAALGIARGIAYFHEQCRNRIIHCDIKPENILLDKDFCPKVSDFGLAKLMSRQHSQVVTMVRGTRGYLAPERISSRPITVKVDVYSYGMLLLEIVGGRRNLDSSLDEKEFFYPAWAFKEMENGTASNAVDRRLKGNVEEEEMEEVVRVLHVAFWCIQEEAAVRPSMGEVVRMLEGSVPINKPPMPQAVREFEEESLLSKKHEVVLASLRNLQKRRDDSVQRHRNLVDEIAQDEMKIQAILSGKLDVESVIQASNALCSSQMHTCTSRSLPSEIQSQQEIRVRRFSEAILRSNSPCQELDNICCQNGWIMPSYSVFPSVANECFQASVSVRGIDFESSVAGDFRSNPCEARSSAATNMINKLHAMSDQQAPA